MSSWCETMLPDCRGPGGWFDAGASKESSLSNEGPLRLRLLMRFCKAAAKTALPLTRSAVLEIETGLDGLYDEKKIN